MSILKIIRLLPRSYRRSGIRVAISVLFRAILNFSGLAVLIPIFMLLFNPGGIAPDSMLGTFRNYFHIMDGRTFAIIVCMIILCFIILKNVLNGLLGMIQIKYVTSLYRYYSGKLFENYYQKGLLFFKNANTTALSHKINGVCYNLSQNVLSLSFTMLGEAVLLLLIWIGLAVYSFKIALFTILCLLPIIWLYFYTVRRELMKNGKAENEARRKQARIVSETFKGYVEMEITNAFPLFKKQFEEGLSLISYYRERTDRVLRIPSEMIEIGVVAIIVLLVLLHNGNDEIQVAFGIFAVTILRMLPAIRILMTGWAQLKNNIYVMDIVQEVVDVEPEEKKNCGTDFDPTIFQSEIKVEGISFSFVDSQQEEKPIIDNFSMTIAKGEKVGICGTSGAGKSTLFNLLLGFYAPQKGNIYIDGISLIRIPRAKWHAIIGYVPQEVFIMDGTLAENVALGHSIETIDRNRVMEALVQSSLKTFVDQLPEGLDTRIGENGSRLSGGQRQRVGIARALYKQAAILFFDEATSSLDSVTEGEITKAIDDISCRNNELTMVMISHRESSLACCDKIISL